MRSSAMASNVLLSSLMLSGFSAPGSHCTGGTVYSSPSASTIDSRGRGSQYMPPEPKVEWADAIVSGGTSLAPSTNDGFEGSSGPPVSAPVIPAAVVISVIEHRSVSYAAAMVAVLIDQYKP